MNDFCPVCNSMQYSPMDKTYVQLFGQCWHCDQKEWTAKKLSTEEFERRESMALTITNNKKEV